MATLSILNCNLPNQGLQMKTISSNSSSSSSSPNTPSSVVSDGKSIAIGSNTISTTRLTKTFSKIIVQNVLSENNGNTLNISNNNNVNTIVRKIKDFGMFGTMNNAGAITSASKLTATGTKRPLSETKNNANIQRTPTVAKKPKLNKDTTTTTTPKTTKKSLEKSVNKTNNLSAVATVAGAATKPAGTPGRKGLPLPQAVARRNARERNRVKQVNNGFAALRERIPEEVAEAFESHSNARGTAKKLSKVETLRMAVEYIRSLERLLGFDFPIGGTDANGNIAQSISGADSDSFSLVKDEFDTLSPAMDEPFEDSLSNYDVDEYLSNTTGNNSIGQMQISEPNSNEMHLDLLPSITTLNGLQYIRIPGTNTYQLLTPDIFIGNANSPPSSSIDDEHFNSLIETNCMSPATSSVTNAADLHSSPTAINGQTANANTPASPQPITTSPVTASTMSMAMAMATETATGTGTMARATLIDKANGECVNAAIASSLSQSPVPQVSSPTLIHSSLNLQHQSLRQQQQQQQQHQRLTLSPASNKVLLQSCATADHLNDECDRQFVAPTPPQRIVKQEFNESDFMSPTQSLATTNAATIIYHTSAHEFPLQQQPSQLLLNTVPHSISPPIDNGSNSPIMQSVPTAQSTHNLHRAYELDPNSSSFYDSVVNFKKELNDVLLNTSSSNNTTGISDESMIDAIDWWEAHTPKSDGGGSIIL